MANGAEHDRAIADGPAGGIVLDETHRLANQGLIDVDRAIAPSDVAVMAHPSHFVLGAIFRLAQDAVEAPRRGRIMVGRGGIAERLMRTLFVVETLEVAQALELLAQARGWRIGGVLQQGQMHALVPAVLLRLAGRNALRNHAGLDQPDRQLRQSAGAACGKWRSIGGAQIMRQATLPEPRP